MPPTWLAISAIIQVSRPFGQDSTSIYANRMRRIVALLAIIGNIKRSVIIPRKLSFQEKCHILTIDGATGHSLDQIDGAALRNVRWEVDHLKMPKGSKEAKLRCR